MDSKLLQIDTRWSNWDQTPFSTYFLPHWWNKPRFIRFHMKFFKFKYISTIIKYETGAKLALYILQNDSEASKPLRTCLSCINLIRNPTCLERNDCFDMIENNVSKEIWDKFSPQLRELNRKNQTHNVLEILYNIYLKHIDSLDSHKECINIMNMIRLNDINIKTILTSIYDDMTQNYWSWTRFETRLQH